MRAQTTNQTNKTIYHEDHLEGHRRHRGWPGGTWVVGLPREVGRRRHPLRPAEHLVRQRRLRKRPMSDCVTRSNGCHDRTETSWKQQ